MVLVLTERFCDVITEKKNKSSPGIEGGESRRFLIGGVLDGGPAGCAE